MSYLLTNASALTALQNLTMTQNALATTQSELSTGLAIQNASDNSSYWSISQTMNSDNGALNTVNQALTQSASMLSTFNSGITQAISVVNAIKADLVSASNTADPNKISQIQTDIIGQQNSLLQIVSGASFNGQNWLNGTVNGVSSTQATTIENLTGAYTNSGGVSYIAITASNINLVTVSTATPMALTMGTGILGNAQSGANYGGSGINYSLLGATAAAGTTGRVYMDSTTQQSDIANMIASVNATVAKLETASATVGTAQEQVTTQMTFVSTMQTNLSNGIASLTNADMNQVSTRLQALQTQQQLGVQSLSIANQSSQMILKLFQ
jgi:flagellin